jgi:hypothetical protein
VCQDVPEYFYSGFFISAQHFPETDPPSDEFLTPAAFWQLSVSRYGGLCREDPEIKTQLTGT